MIKKLLLKILSKDIKERWKLEDDSTMAQPGEKLISVPWYRSKAKLGFLVFMIVSALKYGPQAFGCMPVEIPPELLNFLQDMGFGIGAYGIRDAMKQPENQLYKNVP